jgi:hypothetical protein
MIDTVKIINSGIRKYGPIIYVAEYRMEHQRAACARVQICRVAIELGVHHDDDELKNNSRHVYRYQYGMIRAICSSEGRYICCWCSRSLWIDTDSSFVFG